MSQRRELSGSHRELPAAGEALGRVDPGTPITVSVYLKPRPDHATLAPVPHHERRAAMARAREAAHADDFAALASFAEDHGLTLAATDPAQRLARLTGPASAMERAFGTQLHCYQVDGSDYRVRGGPLALPEAIAGRVIAVLGLDTRPIARPQFVPLPEAAPQRGFLPTEVAALYGFAAASAAGQTIGIIELGGGYTDADNAAAFGAMGLPVPPIVAVPVDGGANTPGGEADGEVALDIQVAGGIAVGARLAVYFAPNTDQGFADAISLAVHDSTNKPSALSISWGSPEVNWTGQAVAAMGAALADAAALGVTVAAASGDALATDGVVDGQLHVDYPASDPNVLGCGGTALAVSGGTLTGESVWNSNGGGTGGGVSALFARPAYQSAAGVPAAPAPGGRGVPDVAADADPSTGYRVVVGGQTGVIGGTSAAAPLWAGIAAVLNAGRSAPIGHAHEVLYAHPGALRDVTQGNNKTGGIGWSAAPGWDPCTGLGTPNGAALRAAFGAGRA